MKKRDKSKYLYANYVKDLHDRFVRRLEDIEAQYNFDNEIEFEIAICEILRSFLPLKYGICRGFVVSADGEVEGDDIIIYDQERFPTLRSLTSGSFSQKERIPIEAVYAYIEAKHTFAFKSDLSASSLNTAFKQCARVKKLIARRQKVHESASEYNTYRNSESYPGYQNPPFAIVISRYVSFNGTKVTDRYEIAQLLNDAYLEPSIYNPDFVIAGPDNLLVPSLEINDQIYQTLFLLAENSKAVSAAATRKGIAFGILMAELGYVLDWVTLGKMPWDEILINAIRPVEE
jgi:hypothetical protein